MDEGPWKKLLENEIAERRKRWDKAERKRTVCRYQIAFQPADTPKGILNRNKRTNSGKFTWKNDFAFLAGGRTRAKCQSKSVLGFRRVFVVMMGVFLRILKVSS